MGLLNGSWFLQGVSWYIKRSNLINTVGVCACFFVHVCVHVCACLSVCVCVCMCEYACYLYAKMASLATVKSCVTIDQDMAANV